MKFLIFLGTVRDSAPPKPRRLGLRVSRAGSAFFQTLYKDHSIEVIDPLDYELSTAFKPHFAYPGNKAPAALRELAENIKSADGYIMISPEYNHSMSPALANMLNHFGSSLFSYKPSTIITYSAGQWGGVRAAVTMRTFLSELGCLPVSSMIHVPKAQEIFEEDGSIQDGIDQNRWLEYFSRAYSQMVWWAEAANEQRERVNPHSLVKDFKRDPSQRNAP